MSELYPVKRVPEIPLLYLWIHYKLQEQNTKTMRCKSIIEVVRRNIRLPPKQYNFDILKELEKYKLIEKINRKAGYKINQERYLVIDPFF